MGLNYYMLTSSAFLPLTVGVGHFLKFAPGHQIPMLHHWVPHQNELGVERAISTDSDVAILKG